MAEDKEFKGRRAVLKPAWTSEVFKQLMALVDNKHVEKRACQAMDRIMPHLQRMVFQDDGNSSWGHPDDPIEFFFPDDEMFAVRRAFIQAYAGTRARDPATLGSKRYLLDPLCKELGILKRVRAAVEKQDTSEDFSMEYDDDDTLEEGEEVDLEEESEKVGDESKAGNGDPAPAPEKQVPEKA